MPKIDIEYMYERHWKDAVYRFERNLENLKIDIAQGVAMMTRDNIKDGSYMGNRYKPLKLPLDGKTGKATNKKRYQRLLRFGRRNHKSKFGINGGEYPPYGTPVPSPNDTKPLVETGMLWSSISYQTRHTSRGFSAKIFVDKRSFQNGDERHKQEYYKYNNFGGDVDGRPPKRQFMFSGLNPDVNNFVKGLMQGTKKAGWHVFYGLEGSWSGITSAADRDMERTMAGARVLTSGMFGKSKK